MKIIIALLILLHGLIHLMGFAKAFGYGNITQFTKDISKPLGLFWLMAAILFIIAAVLIFLKKDIWWVYSTIAVLISQYLIFNSWQDAKSGTVANIIIIIFIIIGFVTWNFKNKYSLDVNAGLIQSAGLQTSILTDTDLQHLPEPVKKYLKITGVVGKPKVKIFKVEFFGQMRKDENSAWMPFTSEQYNFMHGAQRFFFMHATMKHLPVTGYHCYKNGKAFMDIRLLSLFKVQYRHGAAMDTSETVTFFNDMCCMAPATLIDNRVKWLDVDGNKVKASFTNNNITIYAWLYFNENGELINFISGDRYAAVDTGMKKMQWSTPLQPYRQFNGYRLASGADAVYAYPKGEFCYGQFTTVNVNYNIDN
ncbi:MAG: DUF6544 family protein [Ferruginibacter sp.]